MELVSSSVENLQAAYRNTNAVNGSRSVYRRSRPGSRSLSPFGSKVIAINQKLSYVERVVLEIIETERLYVQDLRSIVEDYLGGIIDQQELLPMKPEQVSALFGNIEDIYALNRELLQDLDSCRDDPVAVTNCFVEKSHYFDIYTQYCNNYPNSVATLTDCMRNKVLAKFLREKQEMLKHPLPLGSYLLKPVQRILKYHLLLQEIAKHFDIDEDGYEVVVEAIETMTGVAWYINEMKRKHEHAVRQQEIQSLLLNWKGMDLTTYGELVLEGTFRVQRARSERTFFLFDKALLIAKKRGDHFVYKTHIPCSGLMLIESTRESLCFTVTHYKNNKQQHNVQAKTVEEKRVWTHHIKRLILENHHATIPQKAKEAILEMDALYTGHKYSPERIKKIMSTIDPAVTHQSGRRQSEPAKNVLRQLGEKVGLKSRESTLHDASKGFKRQNSEASGNPEKRRSVDVSAFDKEMVEESRRDDSEPEEVYTAQKVKTSEIPLEHPVPDKQDEENESYSYDHDPLDSGTNENSEDLKTFSSDEDEEEEQTVNESKSILPPSVLDQASLIAERFISNISRRSSLALEDGKDIGYITSKVSSRCSSLINLDCADKLLCQNGSSDFPSFHQGVLSDSERANSESTFRKVNSTENVFGEKEKPLSKRRESILSYKDRQLLDKIKTYYDIAEHQDAAFSIKRRESLTYIPTGVVKNSVFKINSLPRYESLQSSLARQRISSSSSNVDSEKSRPTSWSEFVASTKEGESDQTSPQTPHSTPSPNKNWDLDLQAPISDEEFKSPVEMIKMWEQIERERDRKDKDDQKVNEDSTFNSSNHQDRSLNLIEYSEEPLIILEDCDIVTMNEVSTAPTPESASPPRLLNKTNSLDFSDQDKKTPVKLHPTIMELANCMDEDLSEKMKNKVYLLARQYSQRIKCNKPVAHRRLRELEEDMRRSSLPSVQEERTEEKCKLKPALSIPVGDHSTSNDVSPKRLSFSTSGSPNLSPSVNNASISVLSPVKAEKFHWPDVRELRSRYASTSEDHKIVPVNRSQSVPDRMTDQNMCNTSVSPNKELLSHSHSMTIKHYDSSNCITKENHLSGEKPLPMPYINGSPEALLNNRNAKQSIDDTYYITAEAPLENNKKVIILEKVPQSSMYDLENDDTYVHIRSPTTREKISLKAVIERCKAYQESEEYQMREDPSKMDHVKESAREQQIIDRNVAHQNRVKNLREKFQTMDSGSSKSTEFH